MKYTRIERTDGSVSEISRDYAKELLKRYYTEVVCSYDEMLDTPNDYPCPFCILSVSMS